MIERPILFSAPMVRALLSGAKTQTRRLVTPRPPELTAEQLRSGQHYGFYPAPAQWGKPRRFIISGDVQAVREHQPLLANLGIDCPYGAAGDRLWVRETWRAEERPSDGVDGIKFAADDTFTSIENTREAADLWVEAYDNGRHGERWRPSIFMKRWASRITLEVAAVRVERLQAISGDDAKAEGIPTTTAEHTFVKCFRDPVERAAERVKRYAELWDAINGKRAPWKSNPWVWVIDFKQVQP